MHLRDVMVMGSLVASVLAGCGDDDDATSPDAGTPQAGMGSAGASGKAGAGAGKPATGGSGGQSATGDEMVTIRFKAKIGDKDFACNKPFSNIGSTGSTVQAMDFRAFVQDVKLIDDKDKEVPLKLEVREPWQSDSVALLDFEDGTGLCAGEGTSETNSTITGIVPKGSYKAVSFVNGVPDALNHADPVTHKDPLKTYASMSWGWLLGFRFLKVEVVSQSDADAGLAGALLHLGSVGCTNTDAADGGMDYEKPPAITCTKPNRNQVKLVNYKVGESVIVADLAKLFEQSDLSVDSSCHSAGDACPNIIPKVGVGYPDGKPLTTQSFYRLE